MSDASTRTERFTHYGLGVAAITMLGLVVRVLELGDPPLWRDEAFTAAVTTGRGLGPMLDAVRHDSAPPLAYLMMHTVAMFNGSPTALRLVSALSGTAGIPIAAALGRRCGGNRAGVFAAATIAVMPSFVTSSRDARMYALASVLVMLAILLLWRAIEQPTLVRLGPYAIGISLAIHAHYFSSLAILAGAAGGIAVFRPPLRTSARVAIATAIGGMTLIPWLIAARSQFAHVSAPFWVKPLDQDSIVGLVSQFLAGTPVDAGTPDKIALQTLQAVAITGGGLALLALVVALRHHPGMRRPAAFLAAPGLGGIAILAMVSVRHPLLDARYASVLWGPLAVLLGVGLAELRSTVAAAPALIAMALASATLSVAHLHPDTPSAAAYLDSRAGPHDYISASADEYQLVEFYGNQRTRSNTHITADHVAWYWGTAAFPPDAVLPAIPASVASAGGSVYVVGSPTSLVPPALPAGYLQHDRACWLQVCVATYRR